ncbi:hypothetical protein [Maritimibacter sp. DP1N21-5]|uniref:hypothetical protein n=1 Tax=Maritimibacter sp. DP1N21-5 TaxID=2836867 RepID=UPI001C491853|nr:hypothetical protein [Maritimibacter sp. DP1N21-5]MBV7409159.1 hypothetical protein [Maritimibacter sp. DP1N21-5]
MSRLNKTVVLSALALALAAPAAFANPGHNNGTGWGVGKIPPGHQKKMQVVRSQPVIVQQNVLTDYVVIEHPERYDLPVLPANQIYVERDDEIYQVYRDTAIVVQAIGIVSEFLTDD